MGNIRYIRRYGYEVCPPDRHFHARWVWLALFLMGGGWLATELTMPVTEAQASRALRPEWRRTENGWEDRSSWGVDSWKPELHPLAIVALEIGAGLAMLAISHKASRSV